MMELKSRTGTFASFYPESYLLPRDSEALIENWESQKMWILKPSASSRGRGIQVQDSGMNGPPPAGTVGVVQAYISRPLLITRRKFDIRLYAYVASVYPLRIYMHSAGLARFCTREYEERGHADDVLMHLTNFSLNKDDGGFVRCEGEESVESSKWSLAFWLQYMHEQGFDCAKVMAEMERVTVATVIAGMCAIRKTHRQNVPHRHTAYELYGIDIMLDEKLKAYLIEINISPSLSGLDSELDQRLKFPLNLDVLRMARIIECDASATFPCPGVAAVDRHYLTGLTPQRVTSVQERVFNPWVEPVFADFIMVKDYLEETDIKTGFRLVYPTRANLRSYAQCFDRMCYHDIVFNAWIAMDDAKRIDIARKHWSVYTNEMASIQQELAIDEEDFDD
jgi:tubulin polyglutamylase TTLL4